MPTTIAARLTAMGHALPAASAPAGPYASTVKSGNLLFISGQVSQRDDGPGFFGCIGSELSVEDGRRAAESAALSILAQIAAATDGALAAVRRIVRVGVFVASSPDFTAQSDVANGASDLFVAVFGESGRHVRTAIGVAALPLGVCVEVDAIVELA